MRWPSVWPAVSLIYSALEPANNLKPQSPTRFVRHYISGSLASNSCITKLVRVSLIAVILINSAMFCPVCFDPCSHSDGGGVRWPTIEIKMNLRPGTMQLCRVKNLCQCILNPPNLLPVVGIHCPIDIFCLSSPLPPLIITYCRHYDCSDSQVQLQLSRV